MPLISRRQDCLQSLSSYFDACADAACRGTFIIENASVSGASCFSFWTISSEKKCTLLRNALHILTHIFCKTSVHELICRFRHMYFNFFYRRLNNCISTANMWVGMTTDVACLFHFTYKKKKQSGKTSGWFNDFSGFPLVNITLQYVDQICVWSRPRNHWPWANRAES